MHTSDGAALNTSGDSPAKVLVVDDHPENVLAARAVLDRDDCEIIEAQTGAEALRQVLKHDLAVILLDVVMPHMDGFETARRIRERDASRDIPIIFLTATAADVALIYEGYDVGAVDYLLKPVDVRVLKAKVAIFVDRWRKEQQIRRQEAALLAAERKRSESLFEATFENAGVGIAHAATDGALLRANRRFCEIVGIERAHLLRLTLQDIAHPDDRTTKVSALRRLLAGEVSIHKSEERYRHASGAMLWADVAVSLMNDDDGEPRRLIVVLEEVTARRLAEDRAALLGRASQALLSSFEYRSTLQTVSHLAVSDRSIDVSDAGGGVNNGTSTSRSPPSAGPPFADWCVIELSDENWQAVAHANPRLTNEVRHVHRSWLERLRAATHIDHAAIIDGAAALANETAAMCDLAAAVGFRSLVHVPIVVRGKALGSLVLGLGHGGGRVFGAADLATADDVAQRIGFAIDGAHLYRTAQTAVATRDEFLSIASHELRTPLTPLQLQLERLLDEGTQSMSRERVRGLLVACERQVKRLAALVDSLFDVTRIASGKLSLACDEDIDLLELVRDVASRYAEEIERAGCTLTVTAPPVATIEGRWDRIRIEQVLTNLLTNAIKYGGGKPVHVAIERDGDTAAIAIKDGGIGIAPDKIAGVFELFARAVSARSYGGLGLGLFIARQIVEAHGGTIHVESELERGSVFTVRLPCTPSRTALALAADSAAHAQAKEVPRDGCP